MSPIDLCNLIITGNEWDRRFSWMHNFVMCKIVDNLEIQACSFFDYEQVADQVEMQLHAVISSFCGIKRQPFVKIMNSPLWNTSVCLCPLLLILLHNFCTILIWYFFLPERRGERDMKKGENWEKTRHLESVEDWLLLRANHQVAL